MSHPLFSSFPSNRCPAWLCPACESVSLAIDASTFRYDMNRYTRLNKHHGWFDSHDYTYIFSCMVQCSRPECREVVAVSGIGFVDDIWELDAHGHPEPEYIELFQARHFYPPLPLFKTNENCPEKVKTRLTDISSLLTAHPSAAANAIRSLLEVLLDDMNVPRMVLTKSERQHFLKLHARIEDYPHLLGTHYDAFMALKHFGNAGSHDGQPITQSHLDDACEVLEIIIQQLYHKPADISGHIARLDKAFARK